MRFEQLYYFEILLQERSFRKAAERLHIAQPSLTASIKAMEKELDTVLLIRNTKGFTPTTDGEKVLAFAKELSASYQKLWQDIHPEENTIDGTITVVCYKFFSELVLEPFLQFFHAQYPKVKIRLLQSDYHSVPKSSPATAHRFSIVSRMYAKLEDLCSNHMLISDEEFFEQQYQYLPLFTDTIGICVSKASDLLKLPKLYPCDIDSAVHPATVFPIGQIPLVEGVLLSSNNPMLHVNALLKDNAYCLLPYFVYQHYFAQEEAITYRAFDNDTTITWYLMYPDSYLLNETEQCLVNELTTYLKQMKFK